MARAVRRGLSLLAIASGLLLFAHPSASNSAIRIATGLPDMTFRRLGRELSDALQRELPGSRFEVVETPGSVRNLELLERGEADFALSLADVAYMAYSGELRNGGPALRGVRGVAVLHHSRVHVLVARDSSIEAISDLRGKKIAIGPAGSGTAETTQLLLPAFDVPISSVKTRTMPFAQADEQLARGEIDAAFVVAADPVDTVIEAMKNGARLLNIDGPKAQGVRTRYRFLRGDVIPAGTYARQDRTVRTLGIDVLLVCRATLEPEMVRRLTAALFAVLPDLSVRLPYVRRMDIGRAAATPIPLHPGAAWYYREQELAR